LKKTQEKDRIESKPDKNGKRGEAGKSLKRVSCLFCLFSLVAVVCVFGGGLREMDDGGHGNNMLRSCLKATQIRNIEGKMLGRDGMCLFDMKAVVHRVWCIVRTFAGMDRVPPRIDDIVDRLRPMAAKRTIKSIVGKLILAATAYFIWSERNNRLFKNVRKSPEELKDLMMVVVRLKLTTFRFKNKVEVMSMLAKWKLPNNFRIYG
nr:reverse transcriptase domain, reverse transcriptase zinc-binding domain protein [Tanacetum cinerariifolium]